MSFHFIKSYDKIHNCVSFSDLTLLFSAASRYGAVLIPSAPGALHDLAQDNELAKLLNAFVHEKSEFIM